MWIKDEDLGIAQIIKAEMNDICKKLIIKAGTNDLSGERGKNSTSIYCHTK